MAEVFHIGSGGLKDGAGAFKVGAGEGVVDQRISLRQCGGDEHTVRNRFGRGSLKPYHLNILYC